MRRLPFALSAIALLVAAPGPSWGGDIHVDAAAAPGGDGSAAAPFSSIAQGVQLAAAGDVLHLAAGRYVESTAITVGGAPRAAVLVLKPGLSVVGAGRDATILVAPDDGVVTYGITAGDVDGAAVSDLRIEGPCVHGINLRGSSVTFQGVDVFNDPTGQSSAAMDARQGSFPTMTDCTLDGGHVGLLVEFQGGGTFRDCRIGRRPRETLVIIDSIPRFEHCTLEGGGSDTLVITQGSVPAFVTCEIGRGGRWTVRVVGYAPGSVVNLSGNRWFTADVELLREVTQDADDNPLLGARVQFQPLAPPVALIPSSWGRLKSGLGPR